ncbi:hypothetical protein AALP_AA1G134900 [Arabis alpina]|uniref:RRM domain-containing protein n=1 Tax=Arabis alpina TaxID=50452 RepID=A0A087HN08_ARAAL|nr:hypothetical protein AALP_AA1G134900 [Arabis alpina]
MPADHVRSTLFRHFRSWGEIKYLTIEEEKDRPGILKRSGLISLLGDDALDKALQLSGSDLGGWNVVVETLPVIKGDGHFPTIGHNGFTRHGLPYPSSGQPSISLGQPSTPK